MSKLIDPIELVSQILQCEPSSITEEMDHSEHPSWNSLNHVSLIVALEEEYGLSINDESIEKFRNMAEIVSFHKELMKKV